ncbi:MULTISPECIES: NUDIX domain-containing protein [Methylocaldum]|uniref:NUDIX domain-containing protein n=1 Tax=unclassified Methylocaldum TaxID=2622260 RepID=UPI00098B8A9C|nr:NUDIX domain-containing protein [Methylocaldum sp. 14B]MVF21908.1 NUDIX domain-containing protein [Methylocaldum sp. BRCS4]
MDKAFELIKEEPIYRGFFSLSRIRFRHALFRGGWSDYLDRELFHRGRSVAVIPYDPVADQVVLIEQFRVGAMFVNGDPWLLEIVAGAFEQGESPEDVAYREAAEEAGCEITELIRIAEFFPTPGGCSEKITLYCGIVDSRGLGGIHGVEEEHEDILARVASFDQAMDWLSRGRIEAAIPIIGLQWLALNRHHLRARHG